jgi:hypothetical protein
VQSQQSLEQGLILPKLLTNSQNATFAPTSDRQGCPNCNFGPVIVLGSMTLVIAGPALLTNNFSLQLIYCIAIGVTGVAKG